MVSSTLRVHQNRSRTHWWLALCSALSLLLLTACATEPPTTPTATAPAVVVSFSTPTVTPTFTPSATPTPTNTPTTTPTPTPTLTPTATNTPTATPTPTDTPAPSATPRPSDTPTPQGRLAAESSPQTEAAALSSTHSYQLIPLVGGRDPRPATTHPDLNLMLREPQPITDTLALIDINGPTDGDAPDFSRRFAPQFIALYAIYDWDWDCNCRGALNETVGAARLKTTPGDPIFIPHRGADLFQGAYHAVLLYADETTITFGYTREASVSNGYAVHYHGLQTDPNLLALYRSSSGNQLPGLTLNTPIGTATDSLLVAIRDRGAFMDPRSRKDWW